MSNMGHPNNDNTTPSPPHIYPNNANPLATMSTLAANIHSQGETKTDEHREEENQTKKSLQ